MDEELSGVLRSGAWVPRVRRRRGSLQGSETSSGGVRSEMPGSAHVVSVPVLGGMVWGIGGSAEREARRERRRRDGGRERGVSRGPTGRGESGQGVDGNVRPADGGRNVRDSGRSAHHADIGARGADTALPPLLPATRRRRHVAGVEGESRGEDARSVDPYWMLAVGLMGGGRRRRRRRRSVESVLMDIRSDESGEEKMSDGEVRVDEDVLALPTPPGKKEVDKVATSEDTYNDIPPPLPKKDDGIEDAPFVDVDANEALLTSSYLNIESLPTAETIAPADGYASPSIISPVDSLLLIDTFDNTPKERRRVTWAPLPPPHERDPEAVVRRPLVRRKGKGIWGWRREVEEQGKVKVRIGNDVLGNVGMGEEGCEIEEGVEGQASLPATFLTQTISTPAATFFSSALDDLSSSSTSSLPSPIEDSPPTDDEIEMACSQTPCYCGLVCSSSPLCTTLVSQDWDVPVMRLPPSCMASWDGCVGFAGVGLGRAKVEWRLGIKVLGWCVDDHAEDVPEILDVD
ncbi:hypothetical protein BC829DRAFT_443912 [Chytridium lagenaria]|nr:hypothetical protein BC829DRAFT_443912 [Chytridium lagenaria]